jgi:hypothetical protein
MFNDRRLALTAQVIGDKPAYATADQRRHRKILADLATSGQRTSPAIPHNRYRRRD